MFDINLSFEDINVNSIDRDDLIEVYSWIKVQEQFSEKDYLLEFSEFSERFLEYYLGEGELFLRICKGNRLIGVLKGRIEFKRYNEIWIWYFEIENSRRGTGLGSRIIGQLMKQFINKYGIKKFYALSLSNEKKYLNFWNRNGFALERISNNFMNDINEHKTFILLNDSCRGKIRNG